MSRPQIGIDRLPARRLSNEPREAMNCKSCRKRKIKCNRLRPTCEACKVFNCPCIYDAVPKKRGPKTDVLEALLKRVDGLEKQIKTQDKPDSPVTPTKEEPPPGGGGGSGPTSAPDIPSSRPHHPVIEIPPHINNISSGPPSLISPAAESISAPTPTLYPELLVDIYFQRLHGKPLHILDEISTRNRLQNHTLPGHLAFAIYALSARYATQYGGYNNAVRVANDFARRARMELDTDEPSIEALQTLILLSQAAFQSGKGKKAYMYLSMAISMAFALNLHRELPTTLNVSRAEREGRRRLFWACYLLDRFAACGSKRPSLISDESIVLRLPGCQIQPGGPVADGEYFPGTSSLQNMAQSGKGATGGMSMLIGIVRILGITNRYLAAGGVKGDSHFPWHSLSNLSKIRQDLDGWASETQDTFSSLETLFGQPDSTILVLSKLIYHLIHCLIYRPFLPVDLTELSGTSQHQSWQIEATNLCFLHANAIAELVEIGKASSILDWPAFVGYCICTAGTIHVHGAHYRGQNGEVFSASAEFLSREMQQLQELRYIWAGVQHQRDTLQTIYGAHSELVKSLASNPMRFSPVFQLEDFFDRYPGQFIDGGHITFSDIAVDTMHESFNSYPTMNGTSNPYRTPSVSTVGSYAQHQLYQPAAIPSTPTGYARKRRATDQSVSNSLNGVSPTEPFTPTLPSSGHHLPFGQINDFTSDFSFTSTPAHTTLPNGVGPSGPSDKHPHAPQHPVPDAHSAAYDPTFSMPAAPIFDGDTGRSAADNLSDPSSSAYHTSHSQQRPHSQEMAQAPQLMTPDDAGSVSTDPDKDPFLSLLEQLAENEQSRGGPSELDFFLSGNP